MVTRTPWACRPTGLLAKALVLAAALLACGAAPEPPLPSLAQVERGGSPRELAHAFLRVALAGPPGERVAAAMLWGLAACEADAPNSAMTAFLIAHPREGAAHLAGLRLEGALERSAVGAVHWRHAAQAPWLPDDLRARLLLKGAETLARRGEVGDALGLLPPLEELAQADRWRWWGVRSLAGGALREEACQVIVREQPERFGSLCPGEPITRWTRTFTGRDWHAQAQAWLRAGRHAEALQAARRAGREGGEVGARAALAMRQPEIALQLLATAGASPAIPVLSAEAHRQAAWRGEEGERQRRFSQVIAAADPALRPGGDATLAAQARLLQAEAYLELGSFQRGLELLADSDPTSARWEWLRRRAFFLARNHASLGSAPEILQQGGTARGRRLVAYWLGRAAARRGDLQPLRRLAEGEFPDLPAWWAARELGLAGVAVRLGVERPPPPAPPSWAAPLLAWGRVADVTLGWRAELERGPRNNPEWLGWVELAAPRTFDAFPLLLRGDPRLLAGPWGGLPHSLLSLYAPLPWRDEVERAAAKAGVPPWVLAGLVRQESAWNPQARSPAGALGLAQLMPATARELIRSRGYPPSWARQLTDPEVNLMVGARLLADWRSRFGGSWTAALACYNGGERRARVAWERAGGRDGGEFVEGLEVPETWDYVHRVVIFAEAYRLLYWPEGEGYPWTSSR